MIRVRVDLADSSVMADVAVSSALPIATLIPELIRIFPDDCIDDVTAGSALHRTVPAWRLRLANGTIADFESTFGQLDVRDGDRITLVDDPGPIPAPRVIDVADALSDNPPGTRLADRTIGNVLALVSSILVAAALVGLSSSDYVLAAAGSFTLAVAAAAGLRIAINTGNAPSAARILAIQILLFSATTGFCFIGVPVTSAASDWRALLATGLALVVSGLGLAYLPQHRPRFSMLLTIGTAGWSLGMTVVTFAVSLNFLGLTSAVAVSAVFCVIALLSAPALCVFLAGIRVPHIPAAGESFDDSDDPNAQSHTSLALRASLLLDGFVLGILIVLAALGSALVVLKDSDDGSWAFALAVCIAIMTAVQSRSHARLIPSMTSAFTAGAIVLTIAWQQWFTGVWPLAIVIALPLCAAIVLPAIPSTRISPTMRRVLEFIEAIAIAISFPLAAIVADVPELIQGFM